VISRMQRSRNSEKDAACQKKAKNNLQSLSSRAYLEQTVVPVVMDGMSALAKERLVTHALHYVFLLRRHLYYNCGTHELISAVVTELPKLVNLGSSYIVQHQCRFFNTM